MRHWKNSSCWTRQAIRALRLLHVKKGIHYLQCNAVSIDSWHGSAALVFYKFELRLIAQTHFAPDKVMQRKMFDELSKPCTLWKHGYKTTMMMIMMMMKCDECDVCVQDMSSVVGITMSLVCTVLFADLMCHTHTVIWHVTHSHRTRDTHVTWHSMRSHLTHDMLSQSLHIACHQGESQL